MFKLFFSMLLLTLNLYSYEKVSVQFPWKHQFEFAGFYIAKEKGFYKDIGLEVELKEFKKGINVLSDVENRVSTYGISDTNLILKKLNGSKITFLNALLQVSPKVLISLRTSNIKSIKDFKNKRIMVNEKLAKQSVLLQSILSSNELNNKDLIYINDSNAMENLINKKVDLIVGYLPNKIYHLEKRKILFDIWDAKDYGYAFYDNMLFTSTQETSENSLRVEKFQKATLKGWEYSFDNIDETIKTIQEKYNTQNKSYDKLFYEANIFKKLSYYKSERVGKIKLETIEEIVKAYKELGIIKSIPDNLENFIFKNKNDLLTREERKWVKNNIIQVGINPWSPITYLNKKGKPDGFSSDIFKLVKENLNLNVKYKADTWDNLLTKLKNKNIDLLTTAYYSDQRAKYGLFTKPYFQTREYIFVRTEDDRIQNFHNLKGKKLAVIEGYGIIDKMKKIYKDIEIIETKDLEESFKLLLDKKVDGVFEARVVALDYIQSEMISGVKAISQDFIEASSLHYFTNMDKPILQSIMQKGLDSIDEKKKKDIALKWLVELNSKSKHGQLLLTLKEQQYLDRKKSIKMCIDPHWMPFEQITKNGHPEGISPEIMKQVSFNLNIPIKLVPTKSCTQTLQYMKERKCDLLPLAMETLKRKEYMDFTTPYLIQPLVVVTKNNNEFISDISQLFRKTLGVLKNSTPVDLIKTKYPQINIVEVDNTIDGLMRVKKGEIFGYVDTSATIGYAMQQKAIFDMKISGQFDLSIDMGAGTRNDEPILNSIIQKGLNSISDVTKNNIINSWFSVKFEKGIDYTLVWNILAGSFTVLFLIIYWNRRLSFANKKILEINKKLHNAQKELKKLAITDHLTKLYNRVKINEVLEYESKRAKRYEKTFGLIILDIDHFKDINDVYGHNKGDEVLIEIAFILQEFTRDTDIVGRWGGEEFLIIASDIDKYGIVKLAENIRFNIESNDFSIPEKITASFGATLYTSTEDIKDTIARADGVLYEVKSAGRNSVKFKF